MAGSENCPVFRKARSEGRRVTRVARRVRDQFLAAASVSRDTVLPCAAVLTRPRLARILELTGSRGSEEDAMLTADLRSIAFFRGCSAKELRQVGRLATTVDVPAGRVLCEEGAIVPSSSSSCVAPLMSSAPPGGSRHWSPVRRSERSRCWVGTRSPAAPRPSWRPNP